MGLHSSSKVYVTDKANAEESLDHSICSSSRSTQSEPTVHSLLSPEDIESEFNRSYTFLHILGRGSSGDVYLVQHKITKKEYACKIIRCSNKRNDIKTMKLEPFLMLKLHHRNILTLYEVYETEGTIWMILEYANGGDLTHALASLPHYNERAIAKLFKQILEAVQCMHNQGIVHRDLTLQNILYCYHSNVLDAQENENQKKKNEVNESEIEIKVADFGLSAITGQVRTKENAQSLKKDHSFKEMWGTLEYFAPEVHEHAYGSQAEIWSLGCILYEILTGELAFPHPEKPPLMIDEVFSKLFHTQPYRHFENTLGWIRLSVEAKDLIKKMLKRNPVQRYDIDECLSHPWITGEGLFVSRFAQKPAELLSVKRVLQERSQRRKKIQLLLIRASQHQDHHS